MSTLNVDKVDPSTGTALEIGTSGDTITVPSGATFVVAGTTEITGTNNVQRPNVNPLIINGDMAVAQRSTSVASITASGYHTIDRWQTNCTAGGTWTQSQDTTVPTGQGFAKSLKMDCTTADGSLAAGDRLIIQQAIEGQNLQYLKKGTSSAESLTVSFWVYATKTGTNIVELWDNDNTRQISKSYTINTTNTWEQKELTFAGDTTGAFGNDNAASLYLNFYLCAGSTYSSGTLNTSWASNTNANRAVGQVNHADSDSNDFYITGIQLEVGEYTSSTIPPFQHESYGDNLARCQRYFYKTSAVLNMPYCAAYCASTTNVRGYITYPQIMRATPSMDRNTITSFTIYAGGTSAAATVVNFYYGNSQQCEIYVNVASGLTEGEGCLIIDNDGTSTLEGDAEL